MPPVRIQDDSGQFEMKGDEPRKNRMLTLTDTAWERLKATATAKGVSRSDLIETAALSGLLGAEQSPPGAIRLDDLAIVLGGVIDDPVVNRGGKDRGAVKRAIAAIIDRLG